VLAVSALFVILGFLVYNGGKSLDWNFFTKLPAPIGVEGGGMANAILGSLEIVALAAIIGIPVGFFAGVYLSEFEDKAFGSIVRYVADLLNGIPSSWSASSPGPSSSSRCIAIPRLPARSRSPSCSFPS
jgi:phosphate transport system permease protein